MSGADVPLASFATPPGLPRGRRGKSVAGIVFAVLGCVFVVFGGCFLIGALIATANASQMPYDYYSGASAGNLPTTTPVVNPGPTQRELVQFKLIEERSARTDQFRTIMHYAAGTCFFLAVTFLATGSVLLIKGDR